MCGNLDSLKDKLKRLGKKWTNFEEIIDRILKSAEEFHKNKNKEEDK